VELVAAVHVISVADPLAQHARGTATKLNNPISGFYEARMHVWYDVQEHVAKQAADAERVHELEEGAAPAAA
jgi:hypothetical protein